MKYQLYIAGVAGPSAAWGLVVKDDPGREIYTASETLERQRDLSRDVADYHALLAAIGWLGARMGCEDDFIIRSHSALLVMQVTGRWPCNSPALVHLHRDAVARLSVLAHQRAHSLTTVLVEIERSQNLHACELIREAQASQRMEPSKRGTT